MDGHTQRGKWSSAGVPHKGWHCTGIEDLGEPSEVCAMCECVEIRYVHFMEHPDYPDLLGVGCVCAEHMENDYVRPRERESRLKNEARRRSKWISRKWRTSASGVSFLNTDGFTIQVFEAEDSRPGWMITIMRRDTLDRIRGRRRFPSLESGKLAAFDALLWVKSKPS